MTTEPRPRSLVCLIGFMGCGKSTVARLLGRQIGWQHVDLDKRIVEVAEQTIPEIFAKRGEPEFRKIEHEQLQRIFGEAAGHRVEITTIRSLKRPAHKLDQVGGRGLLGHRAEVSRRGL